ncbi:MAG: non-canonical purine NTP pyrophosphatase [Candidatus Paceibacterota bacterium]|jgi:XTP/dITP diphosphohydrolase
MKSNKIIFITGNKYKFATAKKALADLDLELVRQDMETPEIQSTNVEDVAMYSARWASKSLESPAFLTDCGISLETFKGFPGPFVKYTNQWFSAEDYINLMKGKENRSLEARDCLAFCQPGKEPKLFISVVRGRVAEKCGRKGMTPIDDIFIPEGCDETLSDMGDEKVIEFWSKNVTYWSDFKKYLKDNIL